MEEKNKIKIELADIYIQIEQYRAGLQMLERRKQVLLQRLFSKIENAQEGKNGMVQENNEKS